MEISRTELKTIITLTVLETAKHFEVGTTELSFTKAYARFGTPFRLLVKKGKVVPRRKGNGTTGTHYYGVSDILAALAEEESPAKLI